LPLERLELAQDPLDVRLLRLGEPTGLGEERQHTQVAQQWFGL
jgi:hypothetical protein